MTGAELGARFTGLDGALSVGGGPWWMHKDRELVFDSEFGGTVFRGQSHRVGLELELRWAPLPWAWLATDLFYTHARLKARDGWEISFDAVYLNVLGPTAYQVVEQTQALSSPPLRHGGHPHESIPEGSAHVALTGEYFLSLKQHTFEIDRIDDAPIGNYNRLAFNVQKATADSRDVVSDHVGHSIALHGTASKTGEESVDFVIRFDEEMAYSNCGPNEDAGVLAEGAQAEAQMTFHFDHIFGDFEEGPPDPEDPDTVNHLAIGFSPFADLATDGTLDIDQDALGQQMTGATFLQLIDAVRTLGHSGEAHCHLD